MIDHVILQRLNRVLFSIDDNGCSDRLERWSNYYQTFYCWLALDDRAVALPDYEPEDFIE